MIEKKDTALILIGEKDNSNTEKEKILERYSKLIEQEDNYGEVTYKLIENGSLNEFKLDNIESDVVLLIPFSLNWNKITEKVIPREIGFEGRRDKVDGKEIIYGKPLGYDDFLIEPILERARRSLNF